MMNHDNKPSYQGVVEHILNLTHNILKHYDLKELPDFVLHHLAQDCCFGFKRAAYFVDNPDFDHFRGVAGYYKGDCAESNLRPWDNPAAFKATMQNAVFLHKINKILNASFKRKNIDLHKTNDVVKLGKDLGMAHPEALSWQMKHGNFGVLLYEQGKSLSEQDKNLLMHAAPFLSFCPI